MSDILITKGQQEDRVQRRLEKYRSRHDESIPRFQHTLDGINEQQKHETRLLCQKFLEPKAKKSSKKTEKKNTHPPAEIQNTNNTGPKQAKRDRNCEEIDLTEHANGHEPKHGHCNGSPAPSYKRRKNDTSMAKFSSDNIHQSKNGSNSNPVSNLNKLVPKDSPTLAPITPPVRYGVPAPPPPDIRMKLESTNHVSNFADLDQCAAALEKDGTTSMGLIEGSSDGLIPSDTLKDLISEISDLNPDFMGDFDFDEDRHSQSTNQSSCFSSHYHTAPVTPASVTFSPRNVKMEEGPSPAATSTASPLPHPSQTPPQAANMFDASSSPSGTNHSTSRSSTPNNSYCPQTTSPPTGGAKSIRMPYESPTNMGHDSPAAQTLKQMAQHHQQQHKQHEISGNFQVQSSQSNSSPARSPFAGDPYSPLSGEFVSTGQAAFRNVRCHSGDGGVIQVKQENPGPGMYGACPSYPRSPVDPLIALAKKSKTPAGNSMGHSKSFTQAHLSPQLPPSYRNSFSPPTSFNPQSNQPIFMQHKLNQPQQLTLQQQQQQQHAVHQGPQMGMGQEMKGQGGVPMSHHQSFPTPQYYQTTGVSDGNCFPGTQQEKGQTINFTQQHLRLSQSGHVQQQPMGRMTGLPNPGQQPLVNHMDRSRPQLRHPPGVEMNDLGNRMPMEVQHRIMMREGMSGGVPGNEMVGRFNNGSPLIPGQTPNQRLNTHRHQLLNESGYHHQQMPPQHMGGGIPPRRLVPCQLPSQDNRISNNQSHSQHHETWHPHSALPDHIRSFHQQQHFHSSGVSQQQQQQNLSFVPNHVQSGFGSYNQRLPHHQSTINKGGDVKGMNSSEDAGLVLKTEADSSEFNLLLEGMGDDYSFDPTSSYQNILDTF